MTTDQHMGNSEFDWRKPAPRARRAAMAIYAWQAPAFSYFAALVVATPFVILTLIAPALFSLSPTVDILAPIADARAAFSGDGGVASSQAPAYLATIAIGDYFSDAPGRIHLISKAISAILVVLPFAYFSVSRLPIVAGACLTGAFTAFVAAPFSGPAELSLVLFLTCSFCFVSASADPAAGRARFDGMLAGIALAFLWFLNPVFSLAAFLTLSACPFLSGDNGLWRYGATLLSFAALAGLAEYLAPGINLMRAEAASGALSISVALPTGDSAIGLAGVIASFVLVLISVAIFGGREHLRSALPAGALAVLAFAAARATGANPYPAFVLASAIAAFSVSSPFYDGLFRNHDRASVSAALCAGALPMFWTLMMILHAAGQFSLQHRVAQSAEANVRTELALVQPGGTNMIRWIEEGRFSTYEARELLALAPIDQSIMLLEAADRAKAMSPDESGFAILAGADAACVIARKNKCHTDSNAAASNANIVFVPRLDLGPAATAAKRRAEVLLYTEFRLAEETPFWEIWVRRTRQSNLS